MVAYMNNHDGEDFGKLTEYFNAKYNLKLTAQEVTELYLESQFRRGK